MEAEGSQKTRQKGDRKSVRGRGCLVAFAVILFLLLLGVARVYRPRFPSSVPTQIGIAAPKFDDREDYQTSIEKRSACSSVIEFFGHGELVMPCMCKDYARFAIYDENGGVVHVGLLSGHRGPEFFQIRIGSYQYLLPRKEFGRVLEEAGVDEARLFAYEQLLHSDRPTSKEHQAEPTGASDGDKPKN